MGGSINNNNSNNNNNNNNSFDDTKFIHCYINVFSLKVLTFWNNSNRKITRIQITGYNKQQMHKFGV